MQILLEVGSRLADRRNVSRTVNVGVRGLKIAADIGVYEFEIGREQELVIDVSLTVRPAKADRLLETIDYALVVEYARALGGERIALIETFAQRLAELCMAHETVERAEVAVAKPGALKNGCAFATATFERSVQ